MYISRKPNKKNRKTRRPHTLSRVKKIKKLGLRSSEYEKEKRSKSSYLVRTIERRFLEQRFLQQPWRKTHQNLHWALSLSLSLFSVCVLFDERFSRFRFFSSQFSDLFLISIFRFQFLISDFWFPLIFNFSVFTNFGGFRIFIFLTFHIWFHFWFRFCFSISVFKIYFVQHFGFTTSVFLLFCSIVLACLNWSINLPFVSFSISKLHNYFLFYLIYDQSINIVVNLCFNFLLNLFYPLYTFVLLVYQVCSVLLVRKSVHEKKIQTELCRTFI